MEHLLYADSKNCALLKEQAIDFIVNNKIEFLKRNMLANAPSGVANDILAAVTRSDEKSSRAGKGKEKEFSAIQISAEGLDVDGLMETLLISAIKSVAKTG